ncbi:MAG: hypothetical protein JOZ99_02965 [Actinobacteria bacterium]|nr:hypothetical protein [Actinomycetota bacterium]
MPKRTASDHALVDCGWKAADGAWAACCSCGWQSGPRDYHEQALSAFGQHRVDALGGTVVRPHSKRRDTRR